MDNETRVFTEIFRKGSRTYFTSSRFFPARVRRDIFYLYGFVRTADNFVDQTPQDREGFESFRAAYEAGRAENILTGNPVIDRFLEISHRHSFEPEWADAFLDSMAMDLEKRSYSALDETLRYIYGSAEVIGLMISSILGLSRDSFPYARLLGRAMQYVNFIRDVKEDESLGRIYFPAGDLEKLGLARLAEEKARTSPDSFRAFIGNQISRYRLWQAAAERGYRFIPRRYLIPIRTAADMYAWTAGRIERNPAVVFAEKVKPSKLRILRQILWNALRPRRG